MDALFLLLVDYLPSLLEKYQTYQQSRAFKAFDSEGNLVDEKQKAMLQGAVEALFYLARDQANREATCDMVKKVMAGEYGSVSLPQNG